MKMLHSFRTFVFCLIFANAAFGQDIIINEIMAGGGSPMPPGFEPAAEWDDATDWVELYNQGAGPVNLAGWSLTDDYALKTKWVFPSTLIVPGQYLVVLCTGGDVTSPVLPAIHMETNFKLSNRGEYLGLFDNGLIVQSEMNPEFPNQAFGYSYGWLPSQYWIMETPTPGAVNSGNTLDGVIKEPQFNFMRGYYTAPLSVSLGLPDQTFATIRYTLDGSQPTETNGAVYSSPISISTTSCLRAVGYASNYVTSPPVTHTYVYTADVLQQTANPTH